MFNLVQSERTLSCNTLLYFRKKIAMGEHWYHSSFKEICFGSNFTDKEITSLLFKIGWGYTLSFVASAIVGKLFGAASVAPYGKFVDTSKITG